jgi:hypothetical protein
VIGIYSSISLRTPVPFGAGVFVYLLVFVLVGNARNYHFLEYAYTNLLT